MDRIIHINEVKKVKGRPYTINLRGTLGHSNFFADLEGVCLNIKSTHPLTDKQVERLEDELNKLFPPASDGKFKKKDIEKVLEDNGGFIHIQV
ncbi:hypothetical protein [Clostridium perfringens]|uniref:hypothetical protein n=1 Tax=Clostridium perfringens TaxID=1502 RepID=UPI0012410F77|nr:hypothetical protein [Clostridium perfringens]MDU7725148.1 hypothetical protein [Clostridium perfringens]BDC01599.1 hypothetical protein CP118TE_13080 [Clostridium perfringens E]